MTTSKPTPARRPIFNSPGIVLAFLAVLLTVHCWREWGMSSAGQLRFIYEYGLIPARWSAAFLSNGTDAVMGALPDINSPGGQWQRFVTERIIQDQRMGLGTAFTYAMLHGSWTQLLINGLWIVVFGTSLARRWGATNFILFCALAAFGGALVCYVMQPYGAIPHIGASGIVGGMIGAAPWYAFAQGVSFAEPETHQPRFTFSRMLRNNIAIIFMLFWLFSIYATIALPGLVTSGNVTISWEVHLGGLLTGFLLFPLIDDRIPKA